MKLASPLQRWRAWRAKRVWLRDPARAAALLRSLPDRGGREEGLLAWLTLTNERNPAEAERLALEAIDRDGDRRFAAATLALVLSSRGDHDAAVEVLRAARKRHPEIVWYDLSLADAMLEAGEVADAEALLERAAGNPPLRRHALKRLSRLALEREDRPRALHFYEQLVALAPDYLIYASDYVTLGELQIEAGRADAARETWSEGAETYPRNRELRRLLREHFGEEGPVAEPTIAAVSEEEVGARRIPVRTRFITPAADVLEIIEEATADVREPGDLVTLAESPAATSQGRILPLELVDPGPLARLLSRFVGSIGPLHSPRGMQGAIMEAGRPRILLGAVAALAGRIVRRRGWFYRVAGPRTAMIDDVAACAPPLDHHLLFGPMTDGLIERLERALGCEVAIVDANHLTGAWVLGASEAVDVEWLTRVLGDNPAGNEDEQTPVVLVRPLGSART